MNIPDTRIPVAAMLNTPKLILSFHSAQLRDLELARNHAERQAERNALLYKAVLGEGVEAVIIIDANGLVLEYNLAARDIFGYPEDVVVGRIATMLMPEKFAQAGDAYIKRYLKNLGMRRRGFTRKFAGRRCDGTVFPVELSINPISILDERLYICTIRDITDRITTNQLIHHYTSELKRSNQALQQFAYVASHDLQEPLRVIASYAELLSRRYKGHIDDKADKFLGYIIEGTGRLQDMIRGILAYARVDTQGKVLQPVNLEKVLLWAMQNLSHAIKQHQAVITHDPLPEVLGDDIQLGQVFQNLIGNAIKYRQPTVTPLIHISAERHDQQWQFAVRDNGIGIEEKFLERVFEIFQRVHDNKYAKGNGIGLTITKKIIERHGGTIWLESQVGAGSTFNFSLKAKESAA